ncbi:flagellin [Sulfuriferula nivalis]|uniref:Flagellin n=1 Tax=Sulfuriferula nivalis TaxID=2675298 RepID=A0A809S9E6_9PROT|nr:flagellin [Sulfuriferula nivalis]BBP00872.1 flagellin [Sulfuriferula nivalis]
MAQVINTNVSALFAGQALNKSQQALQTAQERLSSGLRINSAKDDATGLATATTYDTTIRGANQAARNSNDAISTAQTNDGYMAQITANLQRLYEIGVQLGGTASGAEATALIAENTRINALATSDTGAVIDSTGTVGGAVGTKPTLTATGSSASIATINADLTAVSTARSSYGADMATYGSAVAVLQLQSVNVSASYSRIMDTDYAAETAAASKNNILQQAGTAALAQANQNPQSVLSLLR